MIKWGEAKRNKANECRLNFYTAQEMHLCKEIKAKLIDEAKLKKK